MTTLENRAGGNWVLNLRSLGLLLIAVHCIVAVWHLLLAAKVARSFATSHIWLPVALVTAVHLGVSVVW